MKQTKKNTVKHFFLLKTDFKKNKQNIDNNFFFKTYLKKNVVCFHFSNFKLTSKQTKIQK